MRMAPTETAMVSHSRSAMTSDTGLPHSSAMPNSPRSASFNGKPIAVKKVDAATVQFVAPDPYYALPTVLASVWGIGHHARFGRDALGGFAPAHYLKQFHPKWSSKDEVTRKAAEM